MRCEAGRSRYAMALGSELRRWLPGLGNGCWRGERVADALTGHGARGGSDASAVRVQILRIRVYVAGRLSRGATRGQRRAISRLRFPLSWEEQVAGRGNCAVRTDLHGAAALLQGEEDASTAWALQGDGGVAHSRINGSARSLVISIVVENCRTCTCFFGITPPFCPPRLQAAARLADESSGGKRKRGGGSGC